MKMKIQFYNNPITASSIRTTTTNDRPSIKLEIYNGNYSTVIVESKDGMTKEYKNTTVEQVKANIERITGASVELVTFATRSADMKPLARKADAKPKKLCYTLANAR